MSEMGQRYQAEQFVGAVDAARRMREMSWRDVAKAVSVSPSTMTRLRQGATPDLETFARLADWAQLDMDSYVHVDVDDGNSQLNAMVEIAAALRSDPSLSRGDALVIEEMVRLAYERFAGQS